MAIDVGQILFVLQFLLPIILILVLPVVMVRVLRSRRQALKWETSFILASALAWLGYVRIQAILGPPLPVSAYWYWALEILAVISPICLAVAWLRLNSVTWWSALLLFPLVPVGMFAIWLVIDFRIAT